MTAIFIGFSVKFWSPQFLSFFLFLSHSIFLPLLPFRIFFSFRLSFFLSLYYFPFSFFQYFSCLTPPNFNKRLKNVVDRISYLISFSNYCLYFSHSVYLASIIHQNSSFFNNIFDVLGSYPQGVGILLN